MLITDCKELCGESNECYGINFKGLGVGGLGNCTLLKNLNHTKKPRVKVTYKPKSLCYIKELDFTDNMINPNKIPNYFTLKISGIWETNTDCGITYKFITINHQ